MPERSRKSLQSSDYPSNARHLVANYIPFTGSVRCCSCPPDSPDATGKLVASGKFAPVYC